MRFTEFISEAGSPAQQAATAIAMKKAGKKPKDVAEGESTILSPGTQVTVPHKGKMVSGKIVRYDSGKGIESPAYIVDISEYESLIVPVSRVKQDMDEGELNELAIGGNGDSGDYLKTLASAWYNMDFELLAHIAKQGGNPLKHKIDVQETIERMLERGIHCGDGRVRKYYIGYNSDFDGVEIQSHDHYEHSDTDDDGNDIDSRTGKPWGPYDVIEFSGDDLDESVLEGENWSKHNNKRVGGMSKKSVKSYRRSHPGSKIQTAVTTKPSKLKKGSKAAKRRASFCARMRGMKKHRTGAKTARDPNSNINKSLRRWHCESIEELQELVMLAEQFIRNNKK